MSSAWALPLMLMLFLVPNGCKQTFNWNIVRPGLWQGVVQKVKIKHCCHRTWPHGTTTGWHFCRCCNTLSMKFCPKHSVFRFVLLLYLWVQIKYVTFYVFHFVFVVVVVVVVAVMINLSRVLKWCKNEIMQFAVVCGLFCRGQMTKVPDSFSEN